MKKIILSIFVLFTTVSLFAKADADLVDRYMEISGATQTIESISDQIVAGIEQTSSMYGLKKDSLKIEQIKKIFAPNESLSVVRSYLVNNFNDKDLLTIISFYKSDIGMKLTQASLDSLSPDTQASMLHFMANIRENLPSKERIVVIKKLIKALDMESIVKDIYIKMFNYLNSRSPKEYRLSKQKVNQFMTLMSNAFNRQLFISTLYIYRDINSSDLYKAIKYYNSKAGKTEKIIVSNSMQKMLEEGFKRASQE